MKEELNHIHPKTLSRGFVVFALMALLPSIFLPIHSLATFAKLDLHANIETVGVVVTGADLPTTANLMYRQSGEATWRTGHPLVRIGNNRLIGSLFGLAPSTSYDIKVPDGATEIGRSAMTQPGERPFRPPGILQVNAAA